MVPETWASSVKLSHDVTVTRGQVTVTMTQVSSELCVGGSTPSVGCHIISAAPKVSVGCKINEKPRLGGKSGSDGVRDLGKHCKAIS